MAGKEWVQETRFQGGGLKPGFWQDLGGKGEDEGNPYPCSDMGKVLK